MLFQDRLIIVSYLPEETQKAFLCLFGCLYGFCVSELLAPVFSGLILLQTLGQQVLLANWSKPVTAFLIVS